VVRSRSGFLAITIGKPGGRARRSDGTQPEWSTTVNTGGFAVRGRAPQNPWEERAEKQTKRDVRLGRSCRGRHGHERTGRRAQYVRWGNLGRQAGLGGSPRCWKARSGHCRAADECGAGTVWFEGPSRPLSRRHRYTGEGVQEKTYSPAGTQRVVAAVRRSRVNPCATEVIHGIPPVAAFVVDAQHVGVEPGERAGGDQHQRCNFIGCGSKAWSPAVGAKSMPEGPGLISARDIWTSTILLFIPISTRSQLGRAGWSPCRRGDEARAPNLQMFRLGQLGRLSTIAALS